MKKFDPYIKPREPYKPFKPQKTTKCGNREKVVKIWDGDRVEINGITYDFHLDEDYLELYPVEEVNNPHYDIELKRYDINIKKYEKDLAKYKDELKEWKAQKKNLWRRENSLIS